jgi:diguanylate cyclase (GGDEF)-like protein
MMENASGAPSGDAEHTTSQAPAGWAQVQDSIAGATGLSILLVEGHQPPALVVSNDNSLCEAFQSSSQHGHLCDPYCGEAYQRAMRTGVVSQYTCHAGLRCFVMPVHLSPERPLAVIGGRAFLKSADYRALGERFRVGDLQELLSADVFKNVIFAAPQDLNELARQIEAAVADAAAEPPAAKTKSLDPPASSVLTDPGAASSPKPAPDPRPVLRARKQVRPDSAFTEACTAALNSLSEKHNLASLALLLREKETLVRASATGRFETLPLNIEIGSKPHMLPLPVKGTESLLLRESVEGFTPVRRGSKVTLEPEKTVELFTLSIGEEVKGVLLIGDTVLSEKTRASVAKFCREVALPLEVLRLRDELEQQSRFKDSMLDFTERINMLDPAESYLSILSHSAELLHAERGSLLLFDEGANELAVRAAIGTRAEVAGKMRLGLSDTISGSVLLKGRPLVVRDIELAGHKPAPPDHLYKTKSFISYPIIIGGRKVGVLNVTDKSGGGFYDEDDLELLESIAPHMALALDRAEWREKAAQFQLMSITDPLTGMLNRRYLEERLLEELNRSKRYAYEMSFMMIDIDDFKVYNDRNGHQAGDLALELTAQCLKSALRSADVASRYGGEEFCILLPQTAPGEARIIADRIRRRVERTHYPHSTDQPLGAVTVSIGLSAFSARIDQPATIIRAADRALYLAKHRGKNRVESFEENRVDASPFHAQKNTD